MNQNNSIKKINVFFNEYNLLMGSGGVTYLPLVSGILSANAKKNVKIKNNFKFHKFIFHPETPENISFCNAQRKQNKKSYWRF